MTAGPCTAPSSHRRSPLPFLRTLCLLAGMAAGAQAQTPAAGLDLRQTLAGIVAYTRWPVTPALVRLCVVGAGPHAAALLQQGLPRTSAPPVAVDRPREGLPIAAQCEALYIGELAADAWQGLLPELGGRAVLTVCEPSDACTAGGMVRLSVAPAGHTVRFEVNLDAVARSTVRIHPQVLKLGRRSASKAVP